MKEQQQTYQYGDEHASYRGKKPGSCQQPESGSGNQTSTKIIKYFQTVKNR